MFDDLPPLSNENSTQESNPDTESSWKGFADDLKHSKNQTNLTIISTSSLAFKPRRIVTSDVSVKGLTNEKPSVLNEQELFTKRAIKAHEEIKIQIIESSVDTQKIDEPYNTALSLQEKEITISSFSSGVHLDPAHFTRLFDTIDPYNPLIPNEYKTLMSAHFSNIQKTYLQMSNQAEFDRQHVKDSELLQSRKAAIDQNDFEKISATFTNRRKVSNVPAWLVEQKRSRETGFNANSDLTQSVEHPVSSKGQGHRADDVAWDMLVGKTQCNAEFLSDFSGFKFEDLKYAHPIVRNSSMVPPLLVLHCEVSELHASEPSTIRACVLDANRPHEALVDITVRHPLSKGSAISMDKSVLDLRDALTPLCSDRTIFVGHDLPVQLRLLQFFHSRVVDTKYLFLAPKPNHTVQSLSDLARRFKCQSSPGTNNALQNAQLILQIVRQFLRHREQSQQLFPRSDLVSTSQPLNFLRLSKQLLILGLKRCTQEVLAFLTHHFSSVDITVCEHDGCDKVELRFDSQAECIRLYQSVAQGSARVLCLERGELPIVSFIHL